jgi:hypothetical protein
MDVVKMLNYSEIMKTLEDQMSVYAAYHQDARNKATHFIGVPVIVLSLMIPLRWLRPTLISAPMVTAAPARSTTSCSISGSAGDVRVMGALLWLGR